MDFANEKTFENFFLLCFFVGLAYVFLAYRVLKKRGVDVNSQKVFLGVLLSSSPFVILPFWLKAGISWKFRVLTPLGAMAVGIAYGLVLRKVQKVMRGDIGETKAKKE
jgi:hypothetical protein